MTRKIWSEVEVSAYLDGRLEGEARLAFEADLARDPELRRQVAALRATVALIQAAPLREPPRNYLLTPSMIATPSRRAPQRSRPLIWMRLATALTAVAFAISLTLNVLRGTVPTMAPRPMADSAPAVASLSKESAPIEEPLVLQAPAATEMVVEDMTTNGTPDEHQLERAVLTTETAPPGMGDGAAGGMGAPSNAEEDFLPTPTAQPQLLEKSIEEFPADTTSVSETQVMAMEAAQPFTEATAATFAQPIDLITPMPFDVTGEVTNLPLDGDTDFSTWQTSPPLWLTGVLGIITLILAGVTLWLWRRD